MSYVIEAWTDGSGPSVQALKGERAVGIGGWGAVMMLPGSPFTEEISGAEYDATSSRMEIMAVIMVLQHFDYPSRFELHVDSSYVINAFRQGWIKGWKRNNWITSKQKPVENKDLWLRLIELVDFHIKVDWIKVKGHTGKEHNERADRLAHHAKQSAMRIA